MKTKKIGAKLRVTFTYMEWYNAGKRIPDLPNDIDTELKKEYVIHEVPEDKKCFFEALGWRAVLSISIGRGMKKN